MISIPSNLGFGDRLPSVPGVQQVPSFSGDRPCPVQDQPGEQQAALVNGYVDTVMAGPSVTSSSDSTSPEVPDEEQDTVRRWLETLGLAAYVDYFHQKGLYDMFQLQDFTLEDLQQMKIGTQHRNMIWRSLVEFRNSSNLSAVSSLSSNPDLKHSGSDASTVSLASQATVPAFPSSGGGGNTPDYYEVTRYTFKHTISLKKEDDDHDYC